MTEQLHERLADLASDVGTPAPADPARLWRAGKQRQRRRTAAGAVAACAVVLAGVSGAGLLLPAADLTPAPSATTTTPALPDRLYTPGRWLESNDDDPVGPFAVLALDQNGASSALTAFIGVSARTGEYRRVQLPVGGEGGPGSMSEAALLSPSGRYIAYWSSVGGATGDVASRSEGRPAVYDTVTGRDLSRGWQLENMPEAEHGLSIWDLRWLDDTRFYVQAGEIQGAPGTDGASSSRITGPGWIFDLSATEGPTVELEVPGATRTGEVFASDGVGELLVRAKGSRDGYLLADPRHPDQARAVKVVLPGDGGTGGQVWASPDGRIAMATQTSRGDAALAVTNVDGTNELLESVPAWDVYGWSDRTHVVAAISRPAGGDARKSDIVEVDVRTGKVAHLVTLPATGLNPPQLASGLLADPPVHHAEPDWPTDPRVFIGLGAAAAVLLLAVLWTWRRREQR